MRISVIRTLAACVLLGFVSGAASHGLIQDSPSRNWFYGAITKPDQVANGKAKFPVCGNAFRARGIDFNAGYSLMSLLTHTTGGDTYMVTYAIQGVSRTRSDPPQAPQDRKTIRKRCKGDATCFRHYSRH